MKKFSIKVTTDKPEIIYGLPSYRGRITIGNFSERFIMPIDSWTLNDYIDQWQEAINKLKSCDRTCFVITAKTIEKNPLIELWVLFREHNKIYFQNNFLINDIAKEMDLPNLSDFSSATCYNYVEKKRHTLTESGTKISEWSISEEDFFESVKNMTSNT